MFNRTFLLLALVATAAGDSILPRYKGLVADPENPNWPFNWDKQSGLSILDASYSMHKITMISDATSLGVELSRKNFASNQKVTEMMADFARHSPVPVGQEFLKLAATVFSQRYVKGAVFLQWTDSQGKIIKRVTDWPDRIEAEVTDEAGATVEVAYKLDMRVSSKPVRLLKFSYPSNQRVTLTPEETKEIVDTLTGLSIPLWRAAQIRHFLRLRQYWSQFVIRVPATTAEAEAEDPSLFEVATALDSWDTFRYDHEACLLIERKNFSEGRVELSVTNLQGQQVHFHFDFPYKFKMIEEKDRPSFFPLLIYRDKDESVSLPERIIAGVCQELVGLPIPAAHVTWVAQTLADEPDNNRFVLEIYPDVNLKIQQLMENQQTINLI